MHVWSEIKVGSDGLEYGVRYLLTNVEARHLQAVGVVGPLERIVGMQEAADTTIAQFEKEAHASRGGALQ